MRWMAVPAPFGPLGVAVDDVGVCAVRFDGPPADRAVAEPRAHRLLGQAVEEFAGYFAGELTSFTVPVSIRGGSAFERAVWDRLRVIGYGEMATYGQVATQVGDPGAARAVGTACHRNPVAVIVPCHRVVGANGKPVGFGGGLPRKRLLLELEARVRVERAFSG